MLRIHCLQLWWNLSDPAMEEELHERPLYREFAGLAGAPRLPDEATILRFRHLLEKLQLAPKTGTLVDATQIAAPSSTKNKRGARDPEMHQTKKGNQWHFGEPGVQRAQISGADPDIVRFVLYELERPITVLIGQTWKSSRFLRLMKPVDGPFKSNPQIWSTYPH